MIERYTMNFGPAVAQKDAAYWALRHAIRTNAGGVSDPIQMLKLQKDGRSNFFVKELDSAELEETKQAVDAAEDYLSRFDFNRADSAPAFHSSLRARIHDTRQSNRLQVMGYRVLRFLGTRVLRSTSECLDEIVGALQPPLDRLPTHCRDMEGKPRERTAARCHSFGGLRNHAIQKLREVGVL